MKGLDLAQADIVWIAESDDYCDEELLSMLLPYFRDDRVNLAYTQSKVIGSNDEVYAEDYFHYTDDISTDKWKHTYKRTLHRELNEGFAVKNLIPNASAVLFRKFEFTQYEQEMLLNFKAAGDWLFYLFALKDGLLAFHPEALNCHRRHPNSVISKNDNKTSIILDETIKIQQYIFKNYSIHKTIKLKMENQIKLAFSIEDFDYTAYIKDFSSRSLFDNATNLHILITVSEIGFGGGEIFPIRLANNLSDNLIKVTILNIENRPTVDQVLKMINPEINVISVNDCIRKNIDFKKLIGDYSITTIFSFVWWADKFVYENLRDLDVQWYSYMAGCHESLINTPQVGDFQQIMPDIVHYIDGFVYSADKNLEVFKKYELTKYVNGKLHKVPLGNTKKGRVKKGLKEKYGILKDEFVVTLIARGIPEKGWREAINAVISLRDKGYRIHLLLGGESDFVDQLKRKYKTNKYIDFLDFVSDTSEPIAISDVCLLPTYYSSESMPMVIIEYLSLGKPVIATDIGEIKWMLETEKGIAGTILKLKNGKVDVKNVENAIETYLNTPEQIRAHSELAYEAFQKFSMDRFSQKFLEMVLDND
jgi:glycosyltransferase involved in cell wall biosynthesis